MKRSVTPLLLALVAIVSAACANGAKEKQVVAGNPISALIGHPVDDPHMVAHEGRVYMFACHDFSVESSTYDLRDWWAWSTDDLLHWKLESVLKPEDTFMKAPSTSCWATFGVPMAGGWRWYFSAGPRQIGVVTADTPAGPWRDPLGKPLIAEGQYPTEARDPDILLDDDGTAYIVFGTFRYFIARLAPDGLSLAETARPVVIDKPFGPYGENITDDKPSLHKHGGLYYLSWSSFYAVSKDVYGPYEYRGSVIDPSCVSPEFRGDRADLQFDRHGNFFEFNGQWYYAANDFSQPGRTRYFRDVVIGYVHYRENGDIAPVRIDRTGVGQYDADGDIEAEDWFDARGASNQTCLWGGFDLQLCGGGAVRYPHIHHVPADAVLSLSLYETAGGGTLEFREGAADGRLLGSLALGDKPATPGHATTREVRLENASGELDLWIVAKGPDGPLCRIDSFRFKAPAGQ